jgi:tetratricopeptide (TPR) repeat protein
LLRKAIERLTRRNANPYDSEAFYNLGLCLRYVGRGDEAYDAFYKATWSQACAAASFHALAEVDCSRSRWPRALEHLDRSLRLNADNLRARNLKALVLRKLSRPDEADHLVCETLRLDPLDWWARHLKDGEGGGDLQTLLDLAHDYGRAGLFDEAIGVLKKAAFRAKDLPDQSWGAWPLVLYTLGWLHSKTGEKKFAADYFKQAASQPPDYCFPSRLEDISVLQTAMAANPDDPRAPYYLGNLFYDRRRHPEAIKLWKKSAKLDPGFSIVWRNLGIGFFNILRQPAQARRAYDKAFNNNPNDARLLYERDQLWKRLGEKPQKRLRELEKHPQLTLWRDDLSIELCALYNQTGQHEAAAGLLAERQFQPWEGGEGGPLAQHARAQVALGRAALMSQDFPLAKTHFEFAFNAPHNLSEARHLLANKSDIHFWLGCALSGLGKKDAARQHWLAAAKFKGDFQEMSVRAFSEMTYYSALSWEKLGQRAKARKLFRDLLAYGRKLQKQPAKMDYFATSLPTMLLFDEDLAKRQHITATFLRAQALLGLHRGVEARAALDEVQRMDRSHTGAQDFLEDDAAL